MVSAVGALALAKDLAASKEVTYTRQIAPILWKNCAGCHRPGEVGPFPLLTYEDAAKRADFLAEITASRRMPPWKAEANFGGKFHDERRLSADDVASIASWAKAGAPQGDPEDLPPQPDFPEGWQLGEPDMIVKMAEPFIVPASGRDIYRCFVIPLPIEKDMMVSAVEFRPGNRSVVHHAIMFLDANGAARKKDGRDGTSGYESFGGPGIVPTGGLGAWVPGATPRFLPEGIVKYVKKGSDMVVQLHYHSIGKEETDQSSIGLYFSKKPVRKIVTGVAILDTKLEIPADNPHYEITAYSDVLPVDVHVLGVSPHMHNLGREIKMTAVLPGSTDEVPLVWIKDWDFNWQGAYQFEKPIRLPRGSVIKVQAVYDNSSGNLKNPNSPPKPIQWGEQTKDEMLLCGVQVFTDTLADLKKVATMRATSWEPDSMAAYPARPPLPRKKPRASRTWTSSPRKSWAPESRFPSVTRPFWHPTIPTATASCRAAKSTRCPTTFAKRSTKASPKTAPPPASSRAASRLPGVLPPSTMRSDHSYRPFALVLHAVPNCNHPTGDCPGGGRRARRRGRRTTGRNCTRRAAGRGLAGRSRRLR